MNPEQFEPMGLEAPSRQERTWVYPWIGVLFGLEIEMIGEKMITLL